MQIEILPIGIDGEMQVIAGGMPCAILRFLSSKDESKVCPGLYQHEDFTTGDPLIDEPGYDVTEPKEAQAAIDDVRRLIDKFETEIKQAEGIKTALTFKFVLDYLAALKLELPV